MVEFKAEADAIIKRDFGLIVEHFTTKYAESIRGERVSFEECFYREMTAGKFVGTIKGFPMQRGNWCTKLKLNAISQMGLNGDTCVQYLGIAADEPERIARYIDRPGYRLPLVELGWDEAYCREWCKKHGLLSPTYETATRGGCWFCHNQGVDQLRQLRRDYPELWTLLLKWDNDSPVSFKPDGRTVHDYDRRFQLEDEGFIRADKRFFWRMLDEPLQMRLF